MRDYRIEIENAGYAYTKGPNEYEALRQAREDYYPLAITGIVEVLPRLEEELWTA